MPGAWAILSASLPSTETSRHSEQQAFSNRWRYPVTRPASSWRVVTITTIFCAVLAIGCSIFRVVHLITKMLRCILWMISKSPITKLLFLDNATVADLKVMSPGKGSFNFWWNDDDWGYLPGGFNGTGYSCPFPPVLAGPGCSAMRRFSLSKSPSGIPSVIQFGAGSPLR